MKPQTQTEEILALLVKRYPGSLSTHEIRMETYAVDVPKQRSLLMDIGINVISEPGNPHVNKFGRKIKNTLYRLTPTSYEAALKFIQSKNIKLYEHYS